MKQCEMNESLKMLKARSLKSCLMVSSATVALYLLGSVLSSLSAQSLNPGSSTVPRQYLIYPDLGTAAPTIVWSQTVPVVPATSGVIALDSLSLKRRKVPTPSNIDEFVADKSAAIILGKALFWDMQVGSDGMMACASCHFHAGADNRSRNQLSPGLLISNSKGGSAADEKYQVGAANYQLTANDFPFHAKANQRDRNSKTVRDVNDIVGSQGVISSRFTGLSINGEFASERAIPAPDTYSSIAGAGVRRVSPRNTPSVINAAFNLRNFWDGRAQEYFNGVNPFGYRDETSQLWRAKTPLVWERVFVRLNNASLASQAVGPVLSSFEMSSAGRVFPDLARRILPLRPLANQMVHPQDSVLGQQSLSPSKGLATTTYAELIRRAFRKEWWQGSFSIAIDAAKSAQEKSAELQVAANNGITILKDDNSLGLTLPVGRNYAQMEANFSLFFGLAIQLYESTLVSDDAPIDRFAEGDLSALTTIQQRGLGVFLGKGGCASCHSDAEFTAATVFRINNLELGRSRVELTQTPDAKMAVYDNGFYNLGIRPADDDLGVGSKDPYGNPLSEADILRTKPDRFKALVGPESFVPVLPGDRLMTRGAFKTPSLRNVELTAPYFHTGGYSSLRDVVEFYNRGGNFYSKDTFIAMRLPLNLSDDDVTAVVEFLKALTDDRVRTDRAPFDHPQITIPNGHQGSTTWVPQVSAMVGKDLLIEIPAVGRNGGAPRKNFLQ